MDTEKETDCVLMTADMQLPAHRNILSSCSKVFHAMFHNDTNERRTGEVLIKNVDNDILSILLNFIYKGKIIDLSPDTATRLYAAAHMYDILDLRQACLDFLVKNLNTDNICDTAVFAHLHEEEILGEKVVHFIIEHFEEIYESEKWRNFLVDNMAIANKYLSLALLATKDVS